MNASCRSSPHEGDSRASPGSAFRSAATALPPSASPNTSHAPAIAVAPDGAGAHENMRIGRCRMVAVVILLGVLSRSSKELQCAPLAVSA